MIGPVIAAVFLVSWDILATARQQNAQELARGPAEPIPPVIPTNPLDP